MPMATQTPTTPDRRSALGFGAAAIGVALTAPVMAITNLVTFDSPFPIASTKPDPDAELIRLCDLFTENEAKQRGLFVTVHDEDARDLLLEPLSIEWRGLLHQIEQMDGPTTMAGARAMARAALATCPRDINGDLEVGGDPEGWFHICVAQFLVGSTTA